MGKPVAVLTCVLLCICVLMSGVVLAGMVCPVCKNEYHSRAELKEHYRTEHMGKRNTNRQPTYGYVCRGCGKYFASKTHGARHEAECPQFNPKKIKDRRSAGKTPPGNTAYVCKRCGKRFAKAAECLKHERTCTDTSREPGDRSPLSPPRRTPLGGGSTVKYPDPGPGEVIVVLKNGAKFVGMIEEKTDTSIKLKTPEGAEISFAKDDIKEILKPDGAK